MQQPSTRASIASEDASYLFARLPALPIPSVQPVMILVSGLPGTGKSYFARQMASRCPIMVLESDGIRKALFPKPTYLPSESGRTFDALHIAAERLLRQNISVLVDATNLIERNRWVFYNIAKRSQAKLILVRTIAPSHVVQRRLEQRGHSGGREDNSDADWKVYMDMKPSAEPISREHHVVDTSREIWPVLDQVAQEANRWIYESSSKEEMWTSK